VGTSENGSPEKLFQADERACPVRKKINGIWIPATTVACDGRGAKESECRFAGSAFR